MLLQIESINLFKSIEKFLINKNHKAVIKFYNLPTVYFIDRSDIKENKIFYYLRPSLEAWYLYAKHIGKFKPLIN